MYLFDRYNVLLTIPVFIFYFIVNSAGYFSHFYLLQH